MPIFNISKKNKKKKRVKFSILGLQKGRGFTKKKKTHLLHHYLIHNYFFAIRMQLEYIYIYIFWAFTMTN